jgi:hypothetical protein
MTSPKGTTRHTRTGGQGTDNRTKALGALAGLALTAGFVVTAGAPASARNCDSGVSACQAAQAQTGLVGHIRYP